MGRGLDGDQLIAALAVGGGGGMKKKKALKSSVTVRRAEQALPRCYCLTLTVDRGRGNMDRSEIPSGTTGTVAARRCP